MASVGRLDGVVPSGGQRILLDCIEGSNATGKLMTIQRAAMRPGR
jgi:hypothetical protein